jgi:2'-5' RNA ligase
METHIIKCLEKIARSIAPIAIELSGFGQYHGHTIYAKVVDRSPVSKIVEVIKLRLTSTLKGKSTVKPIYTGDPHLTIARRMLKPQFHPAWSDWQAKDFNSSFWANGMLLLKRKINKHTLQPLENYRVLNYFPFTGKTVRPAQLTIFQ